MAKQLKQKHLESRLQNLKTFDSPDVRLEQYQTPPLIAAHVLKLIELDICAKNILDLGCGCGTLGIGCVLLGAVKVIGVDIDQRAIEIAIENASEALQDFPADTISFIHKDVMHLVETDFSGVHFDTVIMNPPFGTRHQTGIDAVFVQKALSLAPTVYSMHKTSTREFWKRKEDEWNMKVNPILQIEFNLDQTLKFHKRKSHDIEVDLLQFTSLAKPSV